jgi:hypothetical protein
MLCLIACCWVRLLPALAVPALGHQQSAVGHPPIVPRENAYADGQWPMADTTKPNRALVAIGKPVPDAKPKPPLLSASRYTGQTERDAAGAEFLRLRIALEFRTQEARMLLPLGFRGLRFSGAKLDGETPVWGNDPDRLEVLVAAAGNHALVLEALVPVTPVGRERRVAIEAVPATAITTLDVTTLEPALRASVKGGGPVRVQPSANGRSMLSADALGVLTEFELTWQPLDLTLATATPRAAVLGELRVFPDVNMVHTEARLRVEVRGGTVQSMVFRLAADATPLDVVQLDSPADPRGREIEWSFAKAEQVAQQLTLKLRQPLTAADTPALLVLRWRQATPIKPDVQVPIARLELMRPEAVSQTGVIGVWPAGGLRVQFKHDLLATSPPELPAGESRAGGQAFRYWQQPVKLDLAIDPTPLPSPLVEVRGVHTLRQAGVGLSLVSEFDVTPKPGSVVQELEVRWPEGFSLDRRIILSNLIESMEFADGIARLRLAGRQQDRFSLKLEGAAALPTEQPLTLSPPTVLQGRVERGGKPVPVQILHRRGELNLITGELDWWLAAGTRGLKRDAHQPAETDIPLRGATTLQMDPEDLADNVRVALAWRPRRLEVSSATRLFLTQRELQAEQSLRLHSTAAPTQIWLRIPRAVDKGLRLRARWKKTDGQVEVADLLLGDHARQSSPTMSERPCLLPAGMTEQVELLAGYRIPRPPPDVDGAVTLPLVSFSPGEVVEHNTEVALWCVAGAEVRRRADEQNWLPGEPRPSPGPPPALTVRSSTLEAPLAVLITNAETLSPSAVATRIGIDMRPLPEDRLEGRLRVQLSQLRSETLQVRLPAVGRELTILSARVFGRDLPIAILEPIPHPDDAEQSVVRLPVEPAMLAEAGLLDVQFRVPQPSLPLLGTTWRWPAPVLEQVVGPGLTHWRLEPRPGSLALPYDAGVQPEQSWRWLFWLQAPRWANVQESADGRGDSSTVRSSRWGGGGGWREDQSGFDRPVFDRPVLGFVQHGEPRPLQVALVSQQVWLMFCSLLLLLTGLGLYAYRPQRLGWWALLATLLVMALGFIRPGLLLPVLYGLQPGAAVLLGCLGLMLVWQWRWRRRVVLMPGYRRVASRGGSSLLRTQERPPRESALLDPAPLAGSQPEPPP